MKLIIAVCFILTVANANPHWGNHGKDWHKFHHPPPNWNHHEDLPPMPKCAPPSIQEQAQSLTGQVTLTLNSLLDNLFSFKASQKNDAAQSCAAVWVCRKPETGDITITEIDGAQTVVRKESKNGNTDHMSSTERNPKDIEDTETVKSTPFENMKSTEAPNTSGVGLIDIRSSIE